MGFKTGESLYRGVPGLRLELGEQGSLTGGPCMVASNTSWIIVTWDPPVDRQTHMTENNTFHNFAGIKCGYIL